MDNGESFFYFWASKIQKNGISVEKLLINLLEKYVEKSSTVVHLFFVTFFA